MSPSPRTFTAPNPLPEIDRPLDYNSLDACIAELDTVSAARGVRLVQENNQYQLFTRARSHSGSCSAMVAKLYYDHERQRALLRTMARVDVADSLLTRVALHREQEISTVLTAIADTYGL